MMSTPKPELLRTRDWRAVLDVVAAVAEAGDDMPRFATVGAEGLARLVPSELTTLTTLSRCDLANGRRLVFGAPPGAIGPDERAAFDRHFSSHPLVRYHASERGLYAHRISDSVSFARFRGSALYNEYYRPVGLRHAIALPVRLADDELASFVLNRSTSDFTDRELALLDVLRRPLAHLFQRLLPRASALSPQSCSRFALTPREAGVLQWVAAGKTDREVAGLICNSPRTVHKHLQNIYRKLGVETRTAAVMRVLA